MLRTLSTLLFQSLVFGCLCVFLSLGSVELLEDGRVVVTLTEFCEFRRPQFPQGVIPYEQGQFVQLYRLRCRGITGDKFYNDPHILGGDIVRVNSVRNSDFLIKMLENATFLQVHVPRHWYAPEFIRVQIAFSPEQALQVTEYIKLKQYYIIAPLLSKEK